MITQQHPFPSMSRSLIAVEIFSLDFTNCNTNYHYNNKCINDSLSQAYSQATLHPWWVIKFLLKHLFLLHSEILGKESPSPQAASDIVDCYPWKIDNKYYCADVKLLVIKGQLSQSDCPIAKGKKTNAFVVIFDQIKVSQLVTWDNLYGYEIIRVGRR